MDKEEFDIWWDKLTKANCPEDIFGGELPSQDLVALKKVVATKKKEFKKTFKNFEKTSNEEFRVKFLSALFDLLTTWAEEKVNMSCYGNFCTYRVKLRFQVVMKSNRKVFLLEETKRTLSKLEGYNFEGVIHFDRVILLRKGVPLSKGRISEYGTHGATECFHNINGISGAPTIYAKQFELGDMLEIETWNHNSIKSFLESLR